MRKFLLLSIFVISASLSACGNEKKSGQAIVKVNGNEITVHQLNDELAHTTGRAMSEADMTKARKEVLSALIDRQLLVAEAASNKLDRDPNVMRAIERAKAQILVQAYLQSKMSGAGKPTKEEAQAYFQKHPELFSQRKTYDMRELVIAVGDYSEDLKAFADAAKSLDEVATWLDAHKVQYAKNQAARTSSDLPSDLVSKIRDSGKGQLFVVKNGARYSLIGIDSVKDSPVAEEAALPQIVQYLMNQRTQESAKSEIARLRSSAKVEYLDKSVESVESVAPAVNADEKPAAQKSVQAEGANTSEMERGAAALK